MSIGRRSIQQFLLITFLAFAHPLFAATLSGIIYGDTDPLPNAEINLFDDQVNLLSTATSNAAGEYSFDQLTTGNYSITVTPPSDTPFGNSPFETINIAADDVSHNVVLLSGAIKISGQLKDLAGRVIDHQMVTLYAHDSNQQIGNQVYTDEQGFYEFAVAAGSYDFKVSFSSSGHYQNGQWFYTNYPVPDYGYIQYLVNNLQVSNDTIQDLTVPFVRLDGLVVDQQGSPVANTQIRANHYYYDVSTVPATSFSYYNYGTNNYINSFASTDANGEFSVALYQNQSINLVLEPPGEQTQSAITLVENYQINSDTSETFVLAEPFKLSGYLKDLSGRAIDHQAINIFDQETNSLIGSSVNSDSNGYYEFLVSPGTYKLSPAFNTNTYSNGEQRPVTAYPIPDFASIYYLQDNVAVSTDTVQDLVVPFYWLSGKVFDQAGLPVADVQIKTHHYFHDYSQSPTTSYYLRNFANNINSHAYSDSEGNYTIALFEEQTFNLSFSAPSDRTDVGRTLVSDIVLTDNTVLEITLGTPRKLSGKLVDVNGRPLDRQSLILYDQQSEQEMGPPVYTDAEGNYEFLVADGTYKFSPSFQSYGHYTGTEWLRPQYPVVDYGRINFLSNDTLVNGDLEMNIEVPMAILSGHTVDSNGVAVAGIQLKTDYYFNDSSSTHATQYYYYNYATNSYSNGISKVDGSYALGLLQSRPINLNITPPIESGFGITNLKDFSIDDDLSQTIVLTFLDETAPQIISGPYVRNITDTMAEVIWQTDEPATSRVSLVGGQIVSDNNLVTEHSILLSQLTPDTDYIAAVSSDDFRENVSVDKNVEFHTKALADTILPSFIEGPIVSLIGEDFVIVKWQADEAVTGVLTFGTQTLYSDNLNVNHEIRVENLTPATLYEFEVAITDASDNGPTVSDDKQVTTASVADTSAPIIISGPFIVDISDTKASVIWTTSEPATSGVSYNDGSVYNVISDDILVAEHRVSLTALKSSTTYALTVSSTDASGNGPSLSDTLTFTTQAEADTTPPQFIGAPLIQNITHQSVVIRWETDEPADSVIHYGLSESELEQQAARTSLNQHHNLVLTGLLADTVYYFNVSSTDASGNLSIDSQIYSFRSKQIGHQGLPHIVEGPDLDRVTDRSITVSWATDVNTDALLLCDDPAGMRVQVSNGQRSKKHQLSLYDLSANTQYQCSIASTDIHGYTVTAEVTTETNISQVSKLMKAGLSQKMTTTNTTGGTAISTQIDADVQAPLFIVQPAIEVYGQQVVVNWQTDELANGLVQYRQVGDSGWLQSAILTTLFSHQLVITNLEAMANYELQIEVADDAGNKTLSTLTQFSVASNDTVAPEFELSPLVAALADESVVLIWKTNEWATAQVRFGTVSNSLDGADANLALTKDHQLVIPHLIPGSDYSVRVDIQDVAGNTNASQLLSFKTTGINPYDFDGDGLLDSLDPDDDNDGVNDAQDAFPKNSNEWLDTDSDGIGNNADTDDDNDSVDDDNDAFPLDAEEWLDTDSDGVGNNADTDDDGDGMSDDYEVDQGFDPLDATDAGQDADNDGQSNLAEFQAGSNPHLDDYAPEILLPENLLVDANGLLTPVQLGSAEAVDGKDGNVASSPDNTGPFAPGIHKVVWTAQDAAGNQSTAIQTLMIKPLISIAAPTLAVEGGSFELAFQLNGAAIEYPLTLEFGISGTASGEDYDLQSTSVTFVEGETRKSVIVNLTDDGLSDNNETIDIQILSSDVVALGSESIKQIVITEGNIAPQVELFAQQNDSVVTLVVTGEGDVLITADINDANSNDQHEILWYGLEQWNDQDGDENNSEFYLDSSQLSPGLLYISVEVTDNGQDQLTTFAEMVLDVRSSAPQLSDNTDSDGDGLSDLNEGFSDSDNDGLADYLDHKLNPANVLAVNYANRDMGAIQSSDQTSLRIGQAGLTNGKVGLSESELQANYSLSADYQPVSGVYYDFEVRGLAQQGASVKVVLPLTQPIPQQAVYRKWQATTGWNEFIIDGKNSIQSASGLAGVCPAPGSELYQPGLTAGHWCVELTLQDGGPNDADGQANSTVVDPGGVALFVDNNKPTLSGQASSSIEVESDYQFAVSVSDDDNDVLEFSIINQPGWLSFDKQTGVLTGTPSYDDIGFYSGIEIRVTDGKEYAVLPAFDITVNAKTNTVVETQEAGSSGGGVFHYWLLLLIITAGYRRRCN